MTDVLTGEQRSYNMSRIRSRWTKQEVKVHNLLKGRKIRHRMHPKLEGNPDILIPELNTVVFVDGCFWHKCPKCYREPATNREFWIPKIGRNVKKDRETNRKLKKAGFRVVRIWEHEIKKDASLVLKKTGCQKAGCG